MGSVYTAQLGNKISGKCESSDGLSVILSSRQEAERWPCMRGGLDFEFLLIPIDLVEILQLVTDRGLMPVLLGGKNVLDSTGFSFGIK